jgi:hypothetical protein
VACASLPWPGASLIAVAIAGSDDRSGGVAILRASDDSILQVDTYRSAREPIAVGTRRLLISYTESADLLGAGQYESHYILLCGLAPDVWVECLDLVKDRTVVWMGDDPPRSVEQRNHLTIRGDSAVYSRQVTIRESSGKAPVHQELGKVTLALPQLH